MLPPQVEGRADRVENALREPGAIARLHDIRLDNCELVPAKASEMVAASEHFADALGQSHDQTIADVMAECIIGLLEIVEIEIEQSTLGAFALTARNLGVDQFIE